MMATRGKQRGGKKDFVNDVVNTLIKRLKEGTSPFQKSWNPDMSSGLPINATTGNRYRGINSIMLSCQVRQDSRWMTFLQAKENGWNVKKGESGTQIQYWKTHETRVVRDGKGNPILKDGKKQKINYRLERPRVFYSTVFNAEQINGIPAAEKKEITWDPNERAEGILQNSGAIIESSNDDRAYYSPLEDKIILPKKEQFDDAGNYYGVALHELGHWTGHESRLDREILNPFGSQEYAKEELRAEIASMVLGQELYIGRDIDQNVAYVASWIKALEEDPLELFRAATDAEKICALVFSYEQVQEISQKQNEGIDMERTINDHTIKPDEEINEITASAGYSKKEGLQELQNHKNSYFLSGTISSDMGSSELIVFENGAVGELVLNGLHQQRDMRYHSTKQEAFDAQEKIYSNLDNVLAIRQDITDQIAKGGAFTLDVMHIDAEGIVEKIESLDNQEQSTKIQEEKIYLNVPYKEKDEAKALGAKWDKTEKSWYFLGQERKGDFTKWLGRNQDQKVQKEPVRKEKEDKRRYLAVPYGERLAAKNLGAKWESKEKSWFVPQSVFKADPDKFSRWSNLNNDETPPMDPREEFRQTLADMGCDLHSPSNKTDHPVMDGSKQRIAVIDDKAGELSGFYVAHLDGHPAGYIKNHRTNTEIKWKSKGYSLSESEKASLHAVASMKKQERLLKEQKEQEATAVRVTEQLKNLKQVDSPTPYMTAKGIGIHKGTYTDKDNSTIYLPIVDIEGKQWSMAYIQEDGLKKRYAKEGKKEGCFHAVGNGFDSLKDVPALVFSEGYSTAATITQSLGYTTVAVFDSGNLPTVTKKFREKYPDKPIVICGDDDLAVKEKLGVNPGRNKAKEAASAVGGVAIFPIFAPGEQSKHNKDFTDFNDLAQKSVLGKEGVSNQVKTIVDFSITRHQEKVRNQKKEQKILQKQTSKITR